MVWDYKEVKALALPNEWGVICMTETVLLIVVLIALAEVIKNIKK